MAEKAEKKQLTPEEAASLAYERSVASLKDYDPSQLSDEEKVKDERYVTVNDVDAQFAVPQEPVKPVAK